MLNIIVQGILEKKDVKNIDPTGMPKTLMPLIRVQKLDGGKNHEGNLKKTK